MTKKTKEEIAFEAYVAGLNEKKLKVSDNRIIALQMRSKDPNWIEKHSNANEKRKEFGNSEEWKEFTRSLNQRPEWRIKNAEANKKRNENPENVIAFKKAMEKRSENEEWLKNVRSRSQNRSEEWLQSLRKAKAMEGTPIVTPEGAFLKFSEGVRYYMPIWNLKKGGADYRLRKLLNDENVKDFYRISHEEYFMLTGKDC
jgi:hypothetical protein